MGWSIELVSIDIFTEVIYLSQYLCSPREGNLDSVYRILGYLQKNLGKIPGRMEYDPMYEPTDKNLFEVVGIYLYEWEYLYPDTH